MSDEPLGCLLQLLWLPYEIWKTISESSRVGASEMDRQGGRCLLKFAVSGTIVLLLGAIIWIWFSFG